MNIAILIFGAISAIIVLWLLAHLIIEAVLCLVVWHKYKRSNEK